MVQKKGGVPPVTFVFELERDGEQVERMDTGTVPGWAWRPAVAGTYRVKAKATDLHGNQAVSPWSDPFRIAPPLTVSQPQANVTPPRMAGTAEVTWSVTGAGGVGETSFTFEIKRNDAPPDRVQEGAETSWPWSPRQAGIYQVRVLMSDGLGNVRYSPWSEPFRIEPVLQIHALSADRPAPHDQTRDSRSLYEPDPRRPAKRIRGSVQRQDAIRSSGKGRP